MSRFLWNAWYVAAWAHEVSRTLLPRTLLGTKVVLYRKENGQPVALANVCPHRFAPLHRGRLCGDDIECGYHGLRFGPSGRCTHNPHAGVIPQNARVRSFPVVERDSLLWIWLGEPDQAAAQQITDFSHLTSPEHRSICGSILTAAHYEVLADNLMDLSHTQFVHKNYLQSELLASERKIRTEGRTLYLTHTCPIGKPPPIATRYLPDADVPVDQSMEIRWDAPSLIRLTQVITPVSGDTTPHVHVGTHILTPESDATTHYFYASSRSFGRDREDLDAMIREWHRVGFGEQDKPMIEAVQQHMPGSDLFALRPVSLPTDVGAMRVRRALKDLIDAEISESRARGGAGRPLDADA